VVIRHRRWVAGRRAPRGFDKWRSVAQVLRSETAALAVLRSWGALRAEKLVAPGTAVL